MKIYISFGMADKDVAEAVRSCLQAANHETTSSSDISSTEYITSIAEELLRQADVIVFIVGSASSRDSYLQREWRFALELSWDKPEKALIALVIGASEVPTFLKTRQVIRISDDRNCESATSLLLEYLEGNNSNTQIQQGSSNDELRTSNRERYVKMSQEASSFEMSDDDINYQLQWLFNKMKSLETIQPDSIDLASIQLRIADFLRKQTGARDDEKIISLFKSALDILKNNKNSESLQARAQANLAMMLAENNKLDEALNNWKSAIDLYKKSGKVDQLFFTEMQNSLKSLSDKYGNTDTRWKTLSSALENIAKNIISIFK
jgi:chaperonin cofactor prefoldin